MNKWKLVFASVLIFLVILVGLMASCDDDDDDDSGDDDSVDDDDDDTDDDDSSDDDDDDYTDDDDDANPDGEVWTDETTNLMWQAEAEASFYWDEAVSYCENLDWHGYTDWRLPTISELRSFIRECGSTITDGSCTVTDSCLTQDCCNAACSGCYSGGGPGDMGEYWPEDLWDYGWETWSFSKVADDEDYAWIVDFMNGSIYSDRCEGEIYDARCVRNAN